MPQDPSTDVGMLELVKPLAPHWRSLLVVPVATIGLAYGATFLMRPVFTATTVFLPPQQQQSTAAAALSSLGALAALSGGGGGTRSPADQYISFLQSANATDRIIDRFHLMDVYDEKFRDLTRKTLLKNAQATLGKKDGLITLEVDDHDPVRAAAIANAFVDELRRMTATLAVTEAQQRRLFFEGQLQAIKVKLTAAQQALQGSGISLGALKSEPKAAADALARLQAQLTAAEVRLQVLRSSYEDGANEVRLAQGAVQALRDQIQSQGHVEPALPAGGDPDYIARYRDFKYQETLFELMSRQYEAARVDEAREGPPVQVVDVAKVPERRSRPVRSKVALAAAFFVTLFYAVWLGARARWRANRPAQAPAQA
jgi:capsule polysaccharide export protein KpsE/RkpR